MAICGAGEEAVVIPLGLKETKELEVADSFRGLVQEHYYEDSEEYEEAIEELRLRQVWPSCRTEYHPVWCRLQTRRGRPR